MNGRMIKAMMRMNQPKGSDDKSWSLERMMRELLPDRRPRNHNSKGYSTSFIEVTSHNGKGGKLQKNNDAAREDGLRKNELNTLSIIRPRTWAKAAGRYICHIRKHETRFSFTSCILAPCYLQENRAHLPIFQTGQTSTYCAAYKLYKSCQATYPCNIVFGMLDTGNEICYVGDKKVGRDAIGQYPRACRGILGMTERS